VTSDETAKGGGLYAYVVIETNTQLKATRRLDEPANPDPAPEQIALSRRAKPSYPFRNLLKVGFSEKEAQILPGS
jgi:hypothetical protein